MDTAVLVAIVPVVALAVIAGFVRMNQSRSRKELQEKFGPEYERAISGSKRTEAERELKERADRVEKLRIKDLSEDDQRRFAEEWRVVQVRFVDDPAGTITEADALVQRVMDR